MERGLWGTAAAITGAIIGAGFASGREIDTFFARYGPWSWVGVAGAAAVITCVLGWTHEMPAGKLWRMLFGALTAVTGGAMTACSGEIAALLLPVHGAKWIGMALALAIGLGCVRRPNALAGFAGVLSITLTGMLAAGLFVPDTGVSLAIPTSVWQALCSGVCYGGMNAVLALPVITDGSCPQPLRGQAVRLSGLLLAALLALGNGVLLRHPSLRGEALPLIRLMAGRGQFGYWLCGLTMELAVLTTLLACAKGLTAMLPGGWKRWWPLPVGVAALCGFERIVGEVYPALGAACLAMLGARGAAMGKKGQISGFGHK